MKTSHKILLTIAILSTSGAISYGMNSWLIFLALLFLAAFLFFLFSLCFISARATATEDRINLAAWRAGLQYKDLVKVGGVQYRVESRHPNNVIELFRYSYENKFVTVDECWPVD